MVPMVLIAAISFAAGSVTFFLPETLNKTLPNTLKDVEEKWGKI